MCRGDGRGRMGEAEAGVAQSEAKERQGLPPSVNSEVRKDSSLKPPEGAGPCRHPNFGLLASRTVRQPVSGAYMWDFVAAAPGSSADSYTPRACWQLAPSFFVS